MWTGQFHCIIILAPLVSLRVRKIRTRELNGDLDKPSGG